MWAILLLGIYAVFINVILYYDDLISINCDLTSISGMTKSCFFNLVDTFD